MTVWANTTIATNVMSPVGFIVELDLILTYSKGQLGRRNGVSPNIFGLAVVVVVVVVIIIIIIIIIIIMIIIHLFILLLLQQKYNENRAEI